MPIRAAGRKKSQFPANQAIPSGSSLDFVINGVNYKITDEDFFAALNVTGSIVQAGSVTGVPVLDTQGTINSIRNLENGPGVAAEITPGNGIKLSQSFAQGSGGVQVLGDPTGTPVIKSLVPDDGIQLTDLGDQIIIGQTQGPQVTTKTVVVSKLSDMPVPVLDVITGLENTMYFFINDLNFGGNRLVLQDETYLASDNADLITLRYTGTETFITSTSGNGGLRNIGIIALAADKLFDVSGPSDAVFRIESSLTFSGDLGDVGDIGIFAMLTSRMSCTGRGLMFTGSDVTGFLYRACTLDVNTGNAFDLGTCVFLTFIIENIIDSGTTGANLITGLAGSGNIDTPGQGIVTGVTSAINPSILVGIDPDDDRWFFQSNNKIRDTARRGVASTSGNGLPTPIVAANTPVKMVSTWVAQSESGYTVDASGTINQNLIKDQAATITVNFSVIKSAGGDQTFTFYIAINGVPILSSGMPFEVDNTTLTAGTVIWDAVLNPTDTVELWCENNDGTAGIILDSAVMRVR